MSCWWQEQRKAVTLSGTEVSRLWMGIGMDKKGNGRRKCKNTNAKLLIECKIENLKCGKCMILKQTGVAQWLLRANFRLYYMKDVNEQIYRTCHEKQDRRESNWEPFLIRRLDFGHAWARTHNNRDGMLYS